MSRTVERQIAHVVALVKTEGVGLDGEAVESLATVERGATVTISRTEEARLEVLGALFPLGETVDDLHRREQVVYEAYCSARRSATTQSDFEATVA